MELTWADKLEARGREMGRIEGRQEGRHEGQIEGMRTLLLGLIEHRFGEVPRDARERVQAIASPDELARLADRVLDAGTLQDLGI